MSQKIKKTLTAIYVLILLLLSLSLFAHTSYAACSPDTPCGGQGTPAINPTNNTSSTSSSNLGNGCNGKSAQDCLTQDPIVKDLNVVVDVLSGAVGIIVVGVIILGGIQYSLAGGSPNATEAAKKRITNGLIALVVFIFTFAFLQWLIPGGI